MAETLQALGGWPGAHFLRDSTIAYATLNAAHILAIGLIIGSIVTLDLRVLGLFGTVPLGVLSPPMTRVAAAGVLFAVASGFLLFSVRPVAYASNPAFLAKVALVAAGILNAYALSLNPQWRIARDGGPLHASVRLGALVSLVIWTGAVLAGRWIGFLQ